MGSPGEAQITKNHEKQVPKIYVFLDTLPEPILSHFGGFWERKLSQKASKIETKSSPENEYSTGRKSINFSMRREGEKAPKIRSQRGDIEYTSCWARYNEGREFANSTKKQQPKQSECASRLKKRTERAQ